MNRLLLIVFFCGVVTLQAQQATEVLSSEKTHRTAIATDTSNVALRTFAVNFKKKYTGRDFVYAYKAPEKNFWDRFTAWLAERFKSLFHFPTDQKALQAVAITLKVIAALIVIFVVYLIAKALLNKEGRWIFGKNSKVRIANYDALVKDLKTADFERLVNEATAAENYRLAIRYYYLWLLREMSEKRLIEWDIEKTNADYFAEITSAGLRETFGYASYLYDYVWYGGFELDLEGFTKMRTTFESALKTIANG